MDLTRLDVSASSLSYEDIYTDLETYNKRDSIHNKFQSIIDSNKLSSIIGAFSVINSNNIELTEKNVYEFALFCGAWYPDIITAQYVIESNSGKSKIARINNNLFGMRNACSRKTVRCKNISGPYAHYNSWQLSVIDRILWDEHMFKYEKPTRNEYINKIGKIYAEDQNYKSKIERLSKEIEERVN